MVTANASRIPAAGDRFRGWIMASTGGYVARPPRAGGDMRQMLTPGVGPEHAEGVVPSRVNDQQYGEDEEDRDLEDPEDGPEPRGGPDPEPADHEHDDRAEDRPRPPQIARVPVELVVQRARRREPQLQ